MSPSANPALNSYNLSAVRTQPNGAGAPLAEEEMKTNMMATIQAAHQSGRELTVEEKVQTCISCFLKLMFTNNVATISASSETTSSGFDAESAAAAPCRVWLA